MSSAATILIAEDEVHIAHVLSIWLKRHGYEILEARNGAVALELLKCQPIDVVISDVNMPVLNGLELARAVRQDLGLAIPFLLLTARCDQLELARQLEPYGVNIYPKPFRPSHLVAEIKRLLGAEDNAECGMRNVDRGAENEPPSADSRRPQGNRRPQDPLPGSTGGPRTPPYPPLNKGGLGGSPSTDTVSVRNGPHGGPYDTEA